MSNYRYRLMYRHYDGSVSVDTEDVSLGYGLARIARLEVPDEFGRDWWLERQPVGEWERFDSATGEPAQVTAAESPFWRDVRAAATDPTAEVILLRGGGIISGTEPANLL